VKPKRREAAKTMLGAQKVATIRDLAKSVVDLQGKELNYLHENCTSLATSAAVLVGFGFAGLGLFEDNLETAFTVLECVDFTLGFDFTRRPDYLAGGPSDSECVRVIFAQLIDSMWALSCGLGLAFNLLTLFITTITAITGPGLALRGPEGALVVAITHMEQQHKRALRFFGRGVAAFTCSILGFGMQSLVRLNFIKGSMLICTGLWTISRLLVYGSDIGAKFHLAASTARHVTPTLRRTGASRSRATAAVPGRARRVRHGARRRLAARQSPAERRRHSTA
jgi:hypothetical protein